MAIEMIEEFDQGTQIKVIGVGGGGGNAVQHMINQGVQGVDTIRGALEGAHMLFITAGMGGVDRKQSCAQQGCQ